MKTGLIKVRVMPRTGLGKRKKANKGVVYLKGAWLRKTVVCVEAQEWSEMMRSFREYKKVMRLIIEKTTIFL